MKAIRIHTSGDPSDLRFEDATLPEPGPDDLLIRVVATSVNPVDWKVREAYLKAMIPYAMQFTMDWDVSGVVAEIGTNTSCFKAGDTVYSRPDIRRDGIYTEYIVVRESDVARKPGTLSHVEAASLPLVSITAQEALFTAANLQPGQRVLIHGGSGGVGTIAMQLARWRGAHVTATTSAKNVDLVRSLGADEVIDCRAGPLSDATGDLDVVFDTIGGETHEASWPLLKRGGMLVSIISPPSEERATAMGLRCAFVFIDPNASILEQLADQVDAGHVRPVIGAEFALSNRAKAHAFSQASRARGRIAIYVGQT